jgi:AAA15 family ATPase/GTPase
MLVYFKVKNFKSVKEPVVINFNTAGISEHTDSNIFQEAGIDLLRTIVLYGHNASGKSKIIDALFFYKTWISESVNESLSEKFFPQPFALSTETEKLPSLFEAEFILNGIRYRYGFELDYEKVHKEWLLEAKSPNGKDYPVFLRMGQEFEIDEKRFPDGEDLIKKTRSNALFLTVGSQWNVEKALEIVHWFKKMTIISGVNDRSTSRKTLEYLQNPVHAEKIKELIKRADLGIEDMFTSEEDGVKTTTIKAGSHEIIESKIEPRIRTMHRKYNEQGEDAGYTSFLLHKDESAGTNKYFNLIGSILFSIDSDAVIVIDEFDARLHTLLSKAIIRLFNSDKAKFKAQLFVSSHDTALLDRGLLRRDQIYFVSKDEKGASSVTALVEYKPRKESPYDKSYLEGKYGAIPFIEEFESLLSNAE